MPSAIQPQPNDVPPPAGEAAPGGEAAGPTASRAVEAVARSIAEEDERLPAHPLQWLGLMLAAGLVGAAAGGVGAAFRECLWWMIVRRNELLEIVHRHVPLWLGWVAPVLCCGAGAWAGLWISQRFAPHTAGSGIPRVEAVLREHLKAAVGRILPVKFVGGVLSIGSGLALGREGPTVQMGATVGHLVSGLLGRVLAEPWTLIAAGAGAGLAVAFNAPLAAALFVMEELLHRFSPRVFTATLIACLVGTLVSRQLVGSETVFSVPSLGVVPSDVLPEYLLLGLAAGLAGVLFNKSLLRSLQIFERARTWPRGTPGALVGGAAGLIAWFAPSAVGGGEVLAQQAITQPLLLGGLAGLLLIRFGLTMASYGCGAPGGIFAPLLALGALLGNAFALVSAHLHHGAAANPAPFAIVAMAACFTAAVRSPLTGVLLLLEMTGSWTLIEPMLAASLTAFVVPELLRNPPVYDSLRVRDEARERRESAEAARGKSADSDTGRNAV